jgi:hypothetical protein
VTDHLQRLRPGWQKITSPEHHTHPEGAGSITRDESKSHGARGRAHPLPGPTRGHHGERPGTPVRAVKALPHPLPTPAQTRRVAGTRYPGRPSRSRALTSTVAGGRPLSTPHTDTPLSTPVAPGFHHPSIATMTPQRDTRAGNRGGDPPGDPGSSPHPRLLLRLPKLTSPNHHQGPLTPDRLNTHKPPKSWAGALASHVPPLPQTPARVTDSDHRSIGRDGRRATTTRSIRRL